MTTKDATATVEESEIAAEVRRAQPIAEAIEIAAEAQDARRSEIMKAGDPYLAAALRELAKGRYEPAAVQFECIADLFHEANWPGEEMRWMHRAADCRSAGRLAKRRARKAGVR